VFGQIKWSLPAGHFTNPLQNEIKHKRYKPRGHYMKGLCLHKYFRDANFGGVNNNLEFENLPSFSI